MKGISVDPAPRTGRGRSNTTRIEALEPVFEG